MPITLFMFLDSSSLLEKNRRITEFISLMISHDGLIKA
jgi:hypothetical protein